MGLIRLAPAGPVDAGGCFGSSSQTDALPAHRLNHPLRHADVISRCRNHPILNRADCLFVEFFAETMKKKKIASRH